MIIEASGLIIDLDLQYINQFKNIENYQVSKKPNFYLKSINESIQYEYKKLEIKTAFYHLYDTNLGKLQIQYNYNIPIGEILYQDNTIIIIPLIKDFNIEYLLSQYAFVYWIRKYTNGIFIHSSSINYQNNGILFCAKSGTGKSTQRRIWEQYGNAICINDDKNVLIFNGKDIEISPNPWSGKHFKNTNIKTKLKTIVFLKQAKENKVEDISKAKAFNMLLNQIQLPSKENEEIWNKNIDNILELPIVLFECNMEEEAFITLKKELEKRGVFNEIKG